MSEEMRKRRGDFPNSRTAAFVGRSSFQQIQMLQQLRSRRPFRERELPDQARAANELRHALEVEVIQCRPGARGGVERSPANQLLALQVLDQRRVESSHKLRRRVEALPDQPGLSPANQRLHLRVSSIARSLYEDEAVRSRGRRAIELPLRRRHPFLVLVPVVESEQPDIDVAPFDLVQVELVRPSIGRRGVLEQEDLEESPDQRVVADVVAQCRALFGELALHAADEDTKGVHVEPCSSLTPRAPDAPA